MDREQLREDVARAIEQEMPAPALRKLYVDPNADCAPLADAAITAAEPHIRADERRKVLEELVADAYGEDFGHMDVHQGTGSFGGSEYVSTLAAWLRSHLDPTP